MKKTRNLIWDNYKGILIFLVVFSHFLYAHANTFPNTITNDIVRFIYMFHMPAFIFCSSYFSVSSNSNSKKSIIKLLMYYLIFNTLMMLYLYFFNNKDLVFMSPYNSYWYLLSLIIWRLSIKYLDKVKKIIPISIIIALLIGYHSDFSNILSIRRTIAFLPFFLMGYKMAKGEIFVKLNDILKGKNKNKNIKKIAIAIIVIFSFIVYLLINKYHISYTMLLMGPYKAYRDVFARIFIFIVAFVMSILILIICPNKHVPILSNAGKNSLGIYVLHRFITLIFLEIYPLTIYSDVLILYSLILSVLIVYLFSSDKLNRWLNDIAVKLTNYLTSQKKNGKLIEIAMAVLLILLLVLKPMVHFMDTRFGNTKNDTVTTEILTPQIKNKIDSAVKLTYVGDLTLLKDQVASAYDLRNNKHYFSDIFKYSESYLKDSDLTIGVLGGTTAGDNNPYSSSNFTEKGNPIINMPDSYISALKKAGFDLINTADNHMFDFGYDGVIRTIDTLDRNGIQHVGTYKDQKSKNNIMVLDVRGVKIAVLSYVSNINGNKVSDIYKKYPYVTSIIPRTTSKDYSTFYNSIKLDFKRAKATNADLILVMMHTGVRYDHENSAFHDKWNDLFSSFGADIILGNSSNSVGSIEYKGNTLIVNSAGNFVNSYQNYDGDSSAIVNIYIDKDTKKPYATDIVPLYSQEQKDGYYSALPIYDAINNKDIYKLISKFELKHIEESLKVTTKIMLQKEVSFNEIEKTYYYIDNKYYIEKDFKKTIQSYKNKELYKLIKNAKRITFIGDSITYGGKNNYHPYYEPLMNYFQGRYVINLSRNGFTTKLVLDRYKKEIANSKSDLYIIALGVNDIRFRNSKISAMNSKEYIKMMSEIISLIKKFNSNASIVLVAPWVSLPGDRLTVLSDSQKKRMVNEYSVGLKNYCDKNKCLYINPNNYIEKEIKQNKEKYMVDCIHPNNSYGIRLYSEALLNESK